MKKLLTHSNSAQGTETCLNRFSGLSVLQTSTKAAFTLAEVLITLGIIGVVAALTIPSLIANYQKHVTLTRLKKAYTVLNQALKLSEADNGEFENWEDIADPNEYIKKYWLPYFNVSKVCYTYKDCGYTQNRPFKYHSGGNMISDFQNDALRTPFMTTDGIIYIISTRCGGDAHLCSFIDVDINGASKPNTAGKDHFSFQRTKSGIVPSGYEKSIYYNNTICAGSGSHCATVIMKNGWQIKDDYPW